MHFLGEEARVKKQQGGKGNGKLRDKQLFALIWKRAGPNLSFIDSICKMVQVKSSASWTNEEFGKIYEPVSATELRRQHQVTKILSI